MSSESPASVLVDGTGLNIVAVKAPSVAAVAADPALVVSLSPNSPVAITSLPLPTGAATEATLALIKAKTDNLDVALSTRAVTGLTDSQLRASPVPVSGTVTANAGTGPWPVTDNGGSLTVDALSWPLPTGAATEATLALIKAKTDNLDVALSTRAITGLTDAQLRATPVPVSATSLPLPTGAATAANQTTIGSQTTTINDGTNTAAVKAASVAPLATDPALVVAISPNSSLPVSGGKANNSVAPGSSNLGVLPAVSTVAAPVYLEGNQVALSVDLTGALRVASTAGGTSSVFGAALPASGTAVGFTDGTNMQAARVFDADSGGGVQNVLGVSLRKTASGGSVEAGTASDPLRTDPTGTTTQPVSDAGGSLTVDSPQLPAALVGGRLDQNLGAWLGSTAPTVGSKTSADSIPVVIASDQSTFPLPTGAATASNQSTLGAQTTKINDGTNTATVKAASAPAVATDTAIVVAISPNNPIVASSASVGLTGVVPPASADLIGGSVTTAAPSLTNGRMEALSLNLAGGLRVDGSGVTQPISAASLPLPTGAATSALQTQPGVDIGDVTVNNAAGAAAVNIQDGGNSITIDATALPLPTGAATETTLVAIDSKTPALGQTTMAASSPVTIASNQTALPVTDNGGSLTVDAVSWPLPTGAATAALQTQPGVDIGDVTVNNAAGAAAVNIQDGGNSITVDGTVGVSGSVAVTGPLTDAELRASAVPISAASLPLPTGAATAANQTTLGNQTTKLNDGTNTATVKPASVAPLATDTALVVSISPNSTLTAVSPSTGLTGAAAPASATLSGGEVSTAAPTYINGDMDSLSLNLAGGLRVDGSGVTQPISAASLPLPTGAATEATLTSGSQKAIVRGGAKGTTTAADVTSTAQSADRQGLDVQIRTSTGAVVDTFGGGTQFADGSPRGTATGTLAMGDDGTDIQSVKVDTAGVLAVQDNGGSLTVDATSWPLPTGAATSALQTQPGVDIGDVTVNNAAGASAVNVQDGGNSLTVDSTQLPAALVGGRLDQNVGAWLGSTAPTVGQKTMANSVPVVLASDQTALTVTPSVSATATLANVASSATSVTLLAANTNRRGVTIYNDSNKTLFVKLGATASATSFTVLLDAAAYYEVPFGYSGIIDGIWSAVNGSARVTEMT